MQRTYDFNGYLACQMSLTPVCVCILNRFHNLYFAVPDICNVMMIKTVYDEKLKEKLVACHPC